MASGIEADDYRILNDEAQPYLYAHELFVVVDDQEPADWETEHGEEGERYAYPPELNEPGFFEDYFDGKTEAIVTFHLIFRTHEGAESEFFQRDSLGYDVCHLQQGKGNGRGDTSLRKCPSCFPGRGSCCQKR